MGHLTPATATAQEGSAGLCPAHALVREPVREGRESRPDPSRREHDHDHTAFSPATPPLDGDPQGWRTPGRLATVLAAAISGLLASAAAATAAFAQPIPIGDGGTNPVAPVPATVRVITTGGMAGWQITLIALGAALAATAAALLLDRKLVGRRGATSTTA